MKYPLFNNTYLKKFYDSGKRDLSQVLIGYFARLKWLMSKPDVDLIWLHCELFPYIPGLSNDNILPEKIAAEFAGSNQFAEF